MTYESELSVAVHAVLKACRLCVAARTTLTSGETMAKEDKSPVTAADFAAQVVISLDLMTAFDYPIIAEEDVTTLRAPGGANLKTKILEHISAILPRLSEEQILAAIDQGKYKGSPRGYYWALDPIDGTKGFLRGEQYAVALALVKDGEVVLGVLGCPNLPVDASRPDGPKGCIFIAVKGEGARMRSFDDPTERIIRVTDVDDPRVVSFCESVGAAHSFKSDNARIAEVLGVTAPPVRIDSQCKYAALARGDVSIYLGYPTRVGYPEKIWDIAAGWIIVKEAGGEVTDAYGHPLDFSVGRMLYHNTGIIGTNGKLHSKVISAVRQVLKSKPTAYSYFIKVINALTKTHK